MRGVDVPVLDGAADDNGDDLALVAGAPSHGSARVVTVRGTPVVRYRSTPGFLGVDQLTCTVDDGHGATATATLTVTVPNTPPVARADAVTVVAGASATGVDVLANDSDANVEAGYGDQVLAVTSATADAGARVRVRPDGFLDVTPAAGYVGVVTVTYVVSDDLADVDGILRVTFRGASGDASDQPSGPSVEASRDPPAAGRTAAPGRQAPPSPPLSRAPASTRGACSAARSAWSCSASSSPSSGVVAAADRSGRLPHGTADVGERRAGQSGSALRSAGEHLVHDRRVARKLGAPGPQGCQVSTRASVTNLFSTPAPAAPTSAARSCGVRPDASAPRSTRFATSGRRSGS